MESNLNTFIYKLPDPCCAIIPDTFEQYYKDISVDARSAYKKNKDKYVVRKLSTLTKNNSQDIVEIWNSSPIRQNRPINLIYGDEIKDIVVKIVDEWPILDYSKYEYLNSSLEFYACFEKNNDKIVAYLELINLNGVSITHSTMGHKNYLKDNIMRYTFVRVVEEKIPHIKYLVYGNNSTTCKSRHFKEDLGITKTGMRNILINESNKYEK